MPLACTPRPCTVPLPSPLLFLCTLLLLPQDLCTTWSRCLKALSLDSRVAHGLSSFKPLLKPCLLRETFPDGGKELATSPPSPFACIQSVIHVQLLVTPWTVRLLCPRDFIGENTGVGSHSLLQGIFPTCGSNPCILHLPHWQVDSLPPAPSGNPSSLFSSCISLQSIYYHLGL